MQSSFISRTIGKWPVLLTCMVSGSVSAQDIAAFTPVHTSPVSVYEQQTNVQTLKNLLKELERLHAISFVCRSEILELKVDVGSEKFSGNTFAERLQKVLNPLRLKLKQISRQQFAISYQNENPGEGSLSNRDVDAPEKQGTAVLLANMAFPAGREKGSPIAIVVTGVVTSGTNNTPVSGVSVSVKGSSTGTTTDAQGRYSITVPNEQAVLVFSSVGYVSFERVVGSQQRLDVVLEEAAKGLSEVVVVGYGTQRKVNLTGAVSAVTAEDLKGRPITATSSGLQGLIPGVTIRSFTAMPGQTGSSIRIRGIGTLGDANPLIVVDGIPGGNMDILNPDDIENISVLKDAASSSIYGVRGANGVILITTKKGRADAKPTISYSNYFGFQTPTAMPEFLGSPDYMTLLNESQLNVGRTPTYTDSMINIARTGSDLNYYANTNWLKEIYKKRAGQQNHNLSINGGGNNLNYYLSYGYLKQDGLVTGDNYGAKRNNVRLRLNSKLLDRLDLDANLGYVDRNYRESSEDISEAGGPIYASHQISPLVPVRFTTGGWGYLGGSRNPVAVA
ncbi:MAG: SusC/RagA family TonB-linked outer membrane protein, partial [Bacteroidota bacterium]|nr:SusC/RagA family TonB-linked outer membrane protein [Bacteroidota bacterium]